MYISLPFHCTFLWHCLSNIANNSCFGLCLSYCFVGAGLSMCLTLFVCFLFSTSFWRCLGWFTLALYPSCMNWYTPKLHTWRRSHHLPFCCVPFPPVKGGFFSTLAKNGRYEGYSALCHSGYREVTFTIYHSIIKFILHLA